MKKIVLILFLCLNLNASNYQSLLFNGNCITCHGLTEQNKSAPTIIEIQKRYKSAFPNKKDFVYYMSEWVYNPKEETSIMKDAIEKYSLMPNLAYDKQTLKEISEYIYKTNFKKQ